MSKFTAGQQVTFNPTASQTAQGEFLYEFRPFNESEPHYAIQVPGYPEPNWVPVNHPSGESVKAVTS